MDVEIKYEDLDELDDGSDSDIDAVRSACGVARIASRMPS